MQMQCYGYAQKDGQWKKEDDTKELHRVCRPLSTQYSVSMPLKMVGSDITDSALSWLWLNLTIGGSDLPGCMTGNLKTPETSLFISYYKDKSRGSDDCKLNK